MADNTGVKSEILPPTEQHYFGSYDHFGIHEEMLKDDVRTLAYRNAIYQNRHMFKDKVVLDVGCGTGILSMFAARAGAKHVIGVDMSNIIGMARKIVKINGFEDKITLIQGKIEEVEIPFPQVDIIISEWMGYFLLYESMLDSVLVARDKYLAPGGLIFPDKSTIYLAAIEDGDYKEEKVGFWKDVYGFDYSPFEEIVLADPLVDIVELKNVVSDPCAIFDIDLYTVTIEDLAFKRDFTLKARRNDLVHAVVGWFDIEFSRCHKPVTFSTGPHAKYTHWKQTVFYLGQDTAVCSGEEITGSISCIPNEKNRRDLDIKLDWKLQTKDENRAAQGTETFVMR
ncbi:S-adenosyl-L-methionine-dependent methyltransferase [Nadsonia fulvescens var. elongata DSM 6958]|uniref:S-adenosyl-L-methionine-dependent methyltransferase n=1 Tax=Nadsonia fulvescens var. elongata DSM 6958 TaxID=857566 RepID=A0A1E3PJM6_9ASCO|nr:S-adenosyl-L-methionine-dependent methyltransferase [Nadsonia fulvescens var. elongata DSM 6958]